jgi:hypothetical protein
MGMLQRGRQQWLPALRLTSKLEAEIMKWSGFRGGVKRRGSGRCRPQHPLDAAAAERQGSKQL